MIHYLETGTELTLDLGDIDEPFYSSLESMFKRILKEIEKQPDKIQLQYLNRLTKVVHSAEDIGWGYYDVIAELLEDYNDRNCI